MLKQKTPLKHKTQSVRHYQGSDETEDHGQRSERKLRVSYHAWQSKQRLASKEVEQQSNQIVSETTVGVGALQVYNRDQLWEEDDVDQVVGQSQQAIGIGVVQFEGINACDGGQDPYDYDGCTHHPHDLALGGL